jgi:hypothetical protein
VQLYFAPLFWLTAGALALAFQACTPRGQSPTPQRAFTTDSSERPLSS